MKTYPIKCLLRSENAATRVDVYDDIGDGGWPGEGLTAQSFTAQLAAVSGPLDVHINSYGGSVADGTAISNAIRAHAGPKRTIVDGFACSIASVIMQAGDERIVQPGSMIMIHDASAMDYGNAAEKRKTAEDLDKHSASIAKQYAARAGGTPEQWRTAMQAETWYDADDAVKAGLADKVGDGTAAKPPSLDLAAFATVPDHVMARLREMPVAAAAAPAGMRHGPFTGTHSHPHAAMGSQGDDAAHEHEHSHDGDGDHGHTHPDAHTHQHVHAAMAAPHEPAPYKRDPDETVCCPGCEKYNDLDARYCDQCGMKLVGREDVTAEPAAADAQARATGAAAVLNAEVDESDWDGPKAMSLAANSDDPAAAYKQICAGRKEGDPSKQASWALPYKYPGKGPNAAGVRNALSRLPQTQGLTNQAEAKALLQRLMKQVNPDYDGDGASDAAPAWLTQTTPAAPAWLDPPKEAK